MDDFQQLSESVGTGVQSGGIPDWLVPTSVPNTTPRVDQGANFKPSRMPNALRRSESGYELMIAEFEMVFPRVLDMICEGYTLTNALADIPIKIDYGQFRRWVKADPVRNGYLVEAEELRTDIWADRALDHAIGTTSTGDDAIPEDVARSKLAFDGYKWRVSCDNKKKYGNLTSVEVSGGISIVSALAAAHSRIIDVEPVKRELISNDQIVED